jgi:hypothetical protein
MMNLLKSAADDLRMMRETAPPLQAKELPECNTIRNLLDKGLPACSGFTDAACPDQYLRVH